MREIRVYRTLADALLDLYNRSYRVEDAAVSQLLAHLGGIVLAPFHRNHITVLIERS